VPRLGASSVRACTIADVRSPIPRSTKVALFAMALGVFVVANDFTSLSVAIPEIEKTFDTTLGRAQWVINGYALVFGVMIVTGGRLADLYGRKRLFMIGALIFAGFSLGCAVAPDVYTLIACRGLMGIGGAIMWPSVLGMMYAVLPEERASLAGALLIGVAGIGNAFGPLLGGALTDAFNWRWIFLINLPVVAIAMFVIARSVSESTGDLAERRMDFRGVLILSVAIVAILVALDLAPDHGFGDPLILALIGFGILLLALFVPLEGRIGERALVPRTVLANRAFAWCCLAVLLMSAIFFAALLYLPQFFEKILGYSPLASGAGLLPMMVVFAAASFAAGSLYDRLGARVVVGGGALALAVGMVLLALLDDHSSYVSLIPGMVVLGVGVGLFYSSVTTVAVTALNPSQSSLAGGIVYMCQVAGGAVGLGINTAIVETADNLTQGITRAFLLDAVLALIGLVVVMQAVESHEPTHHRLQLRWHHRANA
jgi:EmrB/QacA subfamily drug resistance transporter